MAPRSTPTVPAPNPDQRRVAAENYDRARQVIATGNHDYGISLLTLCCQLDPGNFTFRRELRRGAEREVRQQPARQPLRLLHDAAPEGPREGGRGQAGLRQGA